MADEYEGLPVAGYVNQSAEAVALVNTHKAMEERLLRHLDELRFVGPETARWCAIARTHFELGFMALNRAVFQPQRVTLPEDNNG